MRHLLTIASKALSYLLYPLFIPTYGMVLFCYAFSTQVQEMSLVWVMVAIIGTLLLTCLLPLTAILILIKKGEVQDIQIDNPSERTMPYIYTALGFGFWSYLLSSILHAPIFISSVAIGATAAITLVAIINRWWKISAHLTGLGGLLGGLFSYCLGIGAIPTWTTITIWLAISLVLMCARLFLNAHTSAQVVAGWLLGILCTYSPYMIISYGA